MRTFTLLLLSLVIELRAAEQTVKLTPSALAGWSVVGANADELANQSSLALPAGAQLARTFKGHNLVAKLATQPLFVSVAEDCPVLEVGDTALIFVRDGDRGTLWLVEGDRLPVVASTVPLDSDGRATKEIEVVLDQAANEIKVSCAGETITSIAEGNIPEETAIVLSAGSATPWPIGSLTITTYLADEVLPPSTPSADPSQQSSESDSSALSARAGGPLTYSTGGDTAAARLDAAKVKSAEQSAQKFTLEVFTPPAVRTGRAEQVRAAISPVKSN